MPITLKNSFILMSRSQDHIITKWSAVCGWYASTFSLRKFPPFIVCPAIHDQGNRRRRTMLTCRDFRLTII